MIARFFMLAVAVGMLAACAERLTTPADCPALCPGGQVVIRDTIIEAEIGLDSSVAGFASVLDGRSLLSSSGGAYGEVRAIARFISRGDSVFLSDSLRPITVVDSAVVSLILERRDSTVRNLVVDLYRLPSNIDTLVTLAQLDAAMTPETLIGTRAIEDSTRATTLPFVFRGADLAKLAFVPSDSTRLAIGIKVRGDGPTAVRIGGFAGTTGPAFVSYLRVTIADTARQRQVITRLTDIAISVTTPAAAPVATELPVGGIPAQRAFVRFVLPTVIRDSATILRATLELVPDRPIVAIPGDTTRLEARALLADFGPKSPVVSNRGATTFLRAGSDTVRLDVVGLVQLWQGASPLPNVLRLGLSDEYSTFIAPVFKATRAATGRPRLRITYRLPFGFEGF
jgi:hypothetical protein